MGGERDERDDYSGLLGRYYSFYIARLWLGRLVGRALWDSDFSPMYRSLEALPALPDNATVLDLGCGAGLTLRWLDPSRSGRYIGVDNSPSMLARARRTALGRGFTHPEWRLADINAVPVATATADVCLLYNVLHCLDEPETALAEVARCLAPSGVLVGSMLVRGESSRADHVMSREAARDGGTMRQGGTVHDVRRWFHHAGLHTVEVHAAGALAVFRATR